MAARESMPLRELNIGTGLGLARGSAVVCIPVFGAVDLFLECLHSVLEHTPPEVTVLIADDATPDVRLHEEVQRAANDAGCDHEVVYLRQPENGGFVVNVNAAIQVAAPADLIILNSDCVVGAGWYEGLRAAALSESRVATATALTNAGTIVSVPHRNQPVPELPADFTPLSAAEAVRESSLRLRPDLPTCIGHCVYIRRAALELVGDFDTAFSPGYEEEVDFSQRCVLAGLRHVLADDVFVFHHHAGSFGTGQEVVVRRRRHHELITARYPYFDDWVREAAEDRDGPLARAVTAASCALRGLRVAVDGRCLGPTITGTQLVTIGVVAALDSFTDVRLRVLIPEDLGRWARDFLGGRPGVELVHEADVARLEPADVVHRPFQVTAPGDLTLLRGLGNRLVVSQLDNIALRNPGYFGSFAEWQAYRRLTAHTLGMADAVVFISRHAAEDARDLGLVETERTHVVYPATDPAGLGLGVSEAVPPPDADLDGGPPFLLCLGTDFHHKNRVFALRLLKALRARSGFPGRLVFAGPKVASGSSAPEEAEYLLANPELREHVRDLGPVDDAGKQWLLETAAAVVYPTTYEGFGLTPFEAAEAGTPCLFAGHTSLAEILPAATALLAPWDPDLSADRAAPLLRPGPERDQLVRAVRLAGARFTSRGVARGLMETYDRALKAPPVHRRGGGEEPLAGELEELQRRLSEVFDDPLNRGLVGPGAVLPPELRRPVLAVATRPPLRRAALGLYRAAYRMRRAVR